MSVHSRIRGVAEDLRRLIAALERAPTDQDELRVKLRAAASELDRLSTKARRLEREK
jgi:hypothetical protein